MFNPQVFVEALDRCFENVCELDLVFHFDEVHLLLSCIIIGGMVVDVSLNPFQSLHPDPRISINSANLLDIDRKHHVHLQGFPQSPQAVPKRLHGFVSTLRIQF